MPQVLVISDANVLIDMEAGGLPRTVSKVLSMANCDKSDEIAKPAQKSPLRAPALGASGYQRVELTPFCPLVAVAEAMR